MRAKRGGVIIDLTGVEARLLAGLGDELIPLLEGPTRRDGPTTDPGADPVRERLFPRAYLDPTEEQAEEEWQSAVHPELVANKLAALATMAANLADSGADSVAAHESLRVRITVADAEEWIMALNDARVVAGVILDINESADLAALDASTFDEDEPTQALWAAYDMLTELQSALVDAVSR